MPRRPTRHIRPLFTITLKDGIADLHRMPLEHVIRLLNEVKGMMEETGAKLMRERGVPVESADFGLELVTGFQKGSVRAQLLITRNVQVGVEAAQQIVGTVRDLHRFGTRTRQPKVAEVREFNPRVIGRLNSIAKMQDITHTKLHLAVQGAGTKRASAVFDAPALREAKRFPDAKLVVEGVTLFGRLRQLRESTNPKNEDGDKAFYGDLLTDSGEAWRVQFRPQDEGDAARLFRKQVAVTGAAHYYPAAAPKLVAEQFQAEPQRDYLAAFDELFGSEAKELAAPLDDLIQTMRGDD